MNADSEETAGSAADDVSGDPATDGADPSAQPQAEGDDAVAKDSAEDLKAKFREALAHKQGNHGATQGGHGNTGANSPGHEQAHGHRMFRRKSG